VSAFEDSPAFPALDHVRYGTGGIVIEHDPAVKLRQRTPDNG
jgi:hypothetical protein